MKALKMDGNSIELIEIAGGDIEAELHALQEQVGGYIETVRIAEDAVMIVDEEGLLKGRTQNALASLIAKQMLVGTALIVGVEVNADGEQVFCDCPERYVSAYLGI